MIVYVLTNGCYSDYRVVGVYSTLEAAEMAGRIFPNDAGVEEYELDAFVEQMRRGDVPFFVRLQRDSGHTLDVHEETSSYGALSATVGEDIHKDLYTHCWATSRAHAVKIASERRRAFLALPELPPADDAVGER